MKVYKNVIIVGEKDTFISMTYENMYKSITYMKYNNLPCKGINMASNINALAIINKYLGEIYKDKSKENNMHYFVVPNNICKAIKAGTYKNWVKTGKTAGGNPIDKTELYYWTIFASLYSKLLHVFSSFCIKIINPKQLNKQTNIIIYINIFIFFYKILIYNLSIESYYMYVSFF